MRMQRHRMAMTLQQLSAASGVSVGYLSQVERGNATPTLGTLSQIAAALDVDADFFVRTPRTVDSLALYMWFIQPRALVTTHPFTQRGSRPSTGPLDSTRTRTC